MKYVVLSVYDRAAASYGRPVFALSLGAAIRSFQDEINRVDANNEMNRHPKDFDLYELGSFDDQTGEFDCDKGGTVVAIGGQLGLNLQAVS